MITPSSDLVAIAELRKLLCFDHASGQLTWIFRPREMFSSDNACNSWNAKWAGKKAFTAIDGKGYFLGAIHCRLYRAHRVVWALHNAEWPNGEIDHINGIKTDNRIENMRVVSHRQNMMNQPRKRNNTSGVMGVGWANREKKWAVSIKVNGHKKSLGYFRSFEAAVRKRRAAEANHGYHENHGRALL